MRRETLKRLPLKIFVDPFTPQSATKITQRLQTRLLSLFRSIPLTTQQERSLGSHGERGEGCVADSLNCSPDRHTPTAR